MPERNEFKNKSWMTFFFTIANHVPFDGFANCTVVLDIVRLNIVLIKS
jgi:hypothetical protein